MKYIELAIHSWEIRLQGMMTGLDWELYMYLLNTCNRLMWKNPFNVPTSKMCDQLDVSKNTLMKRRNRLKELGLIDFTEGSTNTRPPVYYILPVKKEDFTERPKHSSAAMIIPYIDSGAEDTIEKEEKIPEPAIERKHEVMQVHYTYKDIGQKAMDNIAMHQGINMKIIKECLIQFGKDRESDHQTYKTMPELLKHFTASCKLWAKNSNQNTTKVSVKTGSKK